MENIISLDTNDFIWPKAKPFRAATCEKRPEKARVALIAANVKGSTSSNTPPPKGIHLAVSGLSCQYPDYPESPSLVLQALGEL